MQKNLALCFLPRGLIRSVVLGAFHPHTDGVGFVDPWRLGSGQLTIFGRITHCWGARPSPKEGDQPGDVQVKTRFGRMVVPSAGTFCLIPSPSQVLKGTASQQVPRRCPLLPSKGSDLNCCAEELPSPAVQRDLTEYERAFGLYCDGAYAAPGERSPSTHKPPKHKAPGFTFGSKSWELSWCLLFSG